MVNKGSEKPAVAIYNRVFLNASQTFIYRQLRGVSARFETIVLTRRTRNLERFPFSPIYSKEDGFLGGLNNRLQKYLGVFKITDEQFRHWRAILESESVSLIHAHFGPSGIEMLPLCRLLDIPLLVTFHGFDASKLLRRGKYLEALGPLFAYAHVITVSNEMASRLLALGCESSRLHVHYIGVPVEKFQFVDRIPLEEKVRQQGQVDFLQVARFEEKKGHRYTVLAFAEFLKHYSQAHLTFAGNGHLKNDIEKLCAELGIKLHVSFVGQVSASEVSKLMKNADVFLHHSVTTAEGDKEGIPTAIMEAMATGLIPISTCHSGIPELIEHGVNGYLVEEKDTAGYVQQMLAAFEDNGQFGWRAHNTIERKFNISSQNEKLADIYEALVTQRA